MSEPTEITISPLTEPLSFEQRVALGKFLLAAGKIVGGGYCVTRHDPTPDRPGCIKITAYIHQKAPAVAQES